MLLFIRKCPMKKKLGIIGIALILVSWLVVFDIPVSSQVIQISATKQDSSSFMTYQTCYQSQSTFPIDVSGQLKVLVWNIYKENQSTWHQALTQLSDQRQLVLLQESSLTPELSDWVVHQHWQGMQAHAFSMLDTAMGVMNLSKTFPISACAYMAMEPWIRLPKSALIAYYPLSNQQTLAVVNIHAINFAIGIEDYQSQLKSLVAQLTSHQGPIIFAGDFNSWNEQRLRTVQRFMKLLSMKEVTYTTDHRKRFLNYPLDHVYYRGLMLKQALIPETSASDHNPIQVSFALPSSLQSGGAKGMR